MILLDNLAIFCQPVAIELDVIVGPKNYFALGLCDRSVASKAMPLLRLLHNDQLQPARRMQQYLRRVIGRVVIDNDDFDVRSIDTHDLL